MPAFRKYLLTATSVASCDQPAGTSASSILKTTSPSAPEIFAGRRVHSTASITSVAVADSGVARRVSDSPFAFRAGLGPSERGAVTGARDAADELAHRLLRAAPGRNARLAEVLRHRHVRGELGPAGRNFRVVHLEDDAEVPAGWS